MEIRCHFDHYNINVTDLERSLEFYKKALNLRKTGEILGPDGEFMINYLEAPEGDFRLELTWLRDHKQPYDLLEKTRIILLSVSMRTTLMRCMTTTRNSA